MASLVFLGDLYKVAHRIQSIWRPAIVTQYITITAQIGAGLDQQGLIDSIGTIMGPFFKPLMNSSASYTGAEMQRINTPPPNSLTVATTNGTGPGTSGAAPQAAQVAGIFTLTTFFAGRGFRGRRYIPAPDQTDGLQTPTTTPLIGYTVRLAALALPFTSTVNFSTAGNGWQVTNVLFHKKTRTTTQISGFRVNDKWATQRRRGQYGAAHR